MGNDRTGGQSISGWQPHPTFSQRHPWLLGHPWSSPRLHARQPRKKLCHLHRPTAWAETVYTANGNPDPSPAAVRICCPTSGTHPPCNQSWRTRQTVPERLHARRKCLLLPRAVNKHALNPPTLLTGVNTTISALHEKRISTIQRNPIRTFKSDHISAGLVPNHTKTLHTIN